MVTDANFRTTRTKEASQTQAEDENLSEAAEDKPTGTEDDQ